MIKDMVSVIIPVYNAVFGDLKECYDSIMSQTYSNLELIICDDGSKKECATQCDELALSDSRVRVFHKENGGASSARNFGIAKANGEFLVFVDADDWIEKDYIKKLKDEFTNDIDIVICDRCFELKNETLANIHFFSNELIFTNKEKKKLISNSILHSVGGTWCKMYRRSFIDKNDLRYDLKLRRTQDVIFNLYAFQKAEKVKYIQYNGYHYRMNNESITKKYNNQSDKILTVAALAFSEFVKKYYPDDSAINQYFYHRCINIISEILKLQYFNPYNLDEKKDILRDVKCLFDRDIYKEAVFGIELCKYNTMIGKIKIILMRLKLYNVLRILFKIQYKRDETKNY